MFILMLAMWAVVIYSLRIAVFGNPLPQLVARQSTELLNYLDQRMESRGISLEPVGEEADFIRRFSRSALIEILAFTIEIGLLLFFIFIWEFEHEFFFWLCVGLLCKNLAVFGFSWHYSRIWPKQEGLFKHLLNLPGWLKHLDRASASLSAAVFLVLLIHIFNLLPGIGGGG